MDDCAERIKHSIKVLRLSVTRMYMAHNDRSECFKNATVLQRPHLLNKVVHRVWGVFKTIVDFAGLKKAGIVASLTSIL